MIISKLISKIVEFNRTERQVFVTLRYRNNEGDVIKAETYPVDAVFSYKDDCADIYIEHSQKLRDRSSR